MATAIRMIGHEDHLSLVDHLEELRSRLIVCVLTFAVAFGVCFWQNHTLLHVINGPLAQQTKQQVSDGDGPLGETWLAQQAARQVAKTEEKVLRIIVSPASGISMSSAARAELRAEQSQLRRDVARLPRKPQGADPTTIGFGEPFTQTLTVAFYAALLLSLPVLLFELYGFVLPAFKPQERRVAFPLLLAVPFLFVVGVAFGYFVVLPAATHFFQNFNSGEFNVLVQASSYYKFASLVLIAMGLVFQVPVAVLGVTEAGIVTPRQLRKGRRYALVACAALAAFIPGEVITLVLETVPLYLLYELSVLIATIVEKRRERRERAAGGRGPGGGDGGLAVAGNGGGWSPSGGGAPVDGSSGGPSGSGPSGGTGGTRGSFGAGGGGPFGAGGGPFGGAASAGTSVGDLAVVGGSTADAGQDDTIDPAVREMLDHVDPDLHG